MRFTHRNRFYFIVDVCAWVVIPWLALALNLGSFEQVGAYWHHITVFALVGIIAKMASIRGFGLYQRYWRYASVDELALIVLAVTTAGLAAGLIYLAVAGLVLPGEPRLVTPVLIIDAILTLMQVGGSRFSARLASHFKTKWSQAKDAERTLIVGAGDAGMMIARELQSNPWLGIDPVGFIDDNLAKVGNTIVGIPVLGGRDSLPVIARDYGVSEVIIAMPKVAGTEIREVHEICERAHLKIKIVPGYFEVISGRVTLTQLRDVEIEDLLRRDPVVIDQQEVEEYIGGTTVMVTGAGGSIGSEICRQVARRGASEIVLVGHGENSIFDIMHELLGEFPEKRIMPVIADIRDKTRLDRVFETYRPNSVFHAAAHKHVPLMEQNPTEAVTNNVIGTANLVELAEKHDCGRFVFISTDKAVRPANVMGATKLIAESLVHEAAERSGRRFVSVRFGNVLASRGSVVPHFKKQIARGGPITVTHPDMCRYFMTIPEAVQLVLQAAALGTGGETFVLDMGDPVRIADLAKDLVELSGLEVGRDINIVYTGLRPGEKLNEELFDSKEDVGRTKHAKIFVSRNGKDGLPSREDLAELIAAAAACDALRVRNLIATLVPDAKVNGEAPSQPLPVVRERRGSAISG